MQKNQNFLQKIIVFLVLFASKRTGKNNGKFEKYWSFYIVTVSYIFLWILTGYFHGETFLTGTKIMDEHIFLGEIIRILKTLRSNFSKQSGSRKYFSSKLKQNELWGISKKLNRHFQLLKTLQRQVMKSFFHTINDSDTIVVQEISSKLPNS